MCSQAVDGELTRDHDFANHLAFAFATAATSTALISAAVQPASGKEYTDEEVRQLVAALEEPFDPSEIKRRVTGKYSRIFLSPRRFRRGTNGSNG
jgi:hypothetical protein